MASNERERERLVMVVVVPGIEIKEAERRRAGTFCKEHEDKNTRRND